MDGRLLIETFTTHCREHVSGRFGKIKCLARPIVAPGPFHLVFSCRVSLGRNKRRTATSCSVLGSRILRRRSSFSAYRREMDPQARACSVLPSARRQHFRSPTWLPWLHTLWTPFEQARTVGGWTQQSLFPAPVLVAVRASPARSGAGVGAT